MVIQATSVQDYLEALTAERREALLEMRAMIRGIWNGVSEDLHYGIPTYKLEQTPLWALASQKHFMALYVIPFDLLDAFRKDLRTFDHGRSCVRFRRLDDPTRDLMERIIRYTGACHRDSVHHGKSVILRLPR
ncbi:MAG: DUF1801 domain-containing protein [Flavobacteriales bacterium]|nr:DUF1801 domain-containing protein [Flavobacteriales bacterium]